MATHEHVHDLVATLRPVVSAVPDDRLEAPTPCQDWDVRALANHMLGTGTAMARVGRSEELDPDDPWGTGTDHVTDSWREDLCDRLEEVAEAWDEPGAYEGQAPGLNMPKQVLGQMAFCEVLLHGWDLASATGQEIAFDDAVVSEAAAAMEQIGEMGRQQGAFGALVEAPEGASELDRVLAEGGRDPAWRAS